MKEDAMKSKRDLNSQSFQFRKLYPFELLNINSYYYLLSLNSLHPYRWFDYTKEPEINKYYYKDWSRT